jgi:hypothetical protein
MGGGHEGDDRFVIVPHAPAPLVRPGAGRDGLDDLIDELLPDTDEGPGPTDAALVAGGGAVVAWSLLGSPPVAATVAGVVALGLGCILPLRSAWRWVAGRRRAGAGHLLRVDHDLLARLIAAHDAVDGVAAPTGEARAAAHGAVLEVASLLEGRTPASKGETRYVAARVSALEALVAALQDLDDGGAPAVAPDLVVEAREELDALGGVSALSRLDDVTAEIRARGRRP